ncbi:hypothetical protein STSP2_01638 [Anaerohalosphaera lusitana]|uniref:FecR protein domain-containing protein n=1 Tax=Anaerohalosphaera lusitana TaxID=1936003 RepID=A0A1U9NL67_9BACT|nr:LamG-like jellyroll fold domain-containing protein [Anaerohalosphaera lusitana]AQT68474.1 hypothetical protein STSP2_01638 [Anaerohalosphaera lusitana]
MSKTDHYYTHLGELILESLEGAITEERSAELTGYLKNDQTAIIYYREFVSIYSSLTCPDSVCMNSDEELHADAEQLDLQVWQALAQNEIDADPVVIEEQNGRDDVTRSVVKAPSRQKVREYSKLSIYTAIISSAALVLVLLLPIILPESGPTVAFIDTEVDAEWHEDARPDGSGDIAAGDLQLLEGLARIRMAGGAELVLEGPAQINFKSADSISLNEGKLTAHVNRDAVGFIVDTPNTRVLDLGTEFGVEARNTGCEVHVFDGEVALYPSNGDQKFSVKAGDAKRVYSNGSVSDVRADELAFVTENEYEARLRSGESSYQRWLALKYELQRDPDLVTYYTFEKDDTSPGLLQNLAPVTGNDLDGKIENKGGSHDGWVSGRWPQKSAISFTGPGSRWMVTERNQSASISGPVTIWSWIKVDQDNPGGVIISNRIPGGHCNYRLAVTLDYMEFLRISTSNSYADRSFTNLGSELTQGWHFAAVTHDNKILRFYLDGELVSSQKHEYHPPAVKCRTYVGQHNSGDEKRNDFYGTIGEVGVFKRVLSDREIESIYLGGMPGFE